MGQITYENLLPELADKIKASGDIATLVKVGLVKPDGTTIAVTADGVISVVGGGGTEVAVENVLTSTSTTNALSANMGKTLKDELDTHEGTVASTTVSGHVKVDGTSIKITNGVISATDTVTAIVDNLTSTDTDKALSANQGKVLKDKLDAHELVKATTTVLGHVTVDGTTITAIDGKLSAVLPTAPSTGRFTSTTAINATHKYIFTPSIPLLPTDDLDVVFNTTTLDKADWTLVDVGGVQVITINITYSATDKPENYHVGGRIYRGFTPIV